MIRLVRTLTYRNWNNTNYKIYCIQFEIPIIGHAINNWLFNHNLSDTKFKSKYHDIRYIRYWYRKEQKKKRKGPNDICQ